MVTTDQRNLILNGMNDILNSMQDIVEESLRAYKAKNRKTDQLLERMKAEYTALRKQFEKAVLEKPYILCKSPIKLPLYMGQALQKIHLYVAAIC